MMTRHTAPASASLQPRALARWLLVVAAVVILMIVIGGITRLTESGLSMVRWEPVSGTIPPLNEEQWIAEFDAYKATPEYQKVNSGMSLSEFKEIFFWEYLHRQIGRLIGLGMILPFAWFAWRRAIPSGYAPKFAALTGLVILQGGIGWWMVASGLVDQPDVSHIRLAIHLLTAFLFLGALIWVALDLLELDRDPASRPSRVTPLALLVFAAIAIQFLFGAFVAGLKAGYAFDTWPLMGTELFPTGGWNGSWGFFANIIDNPVVLQFIHRWWAFVAAAAAILISFRVRSTAAGILPLVVVLMLIQIGLGIATLVTGVEIHVAVAHQGVAALIVAAIAVAAHAHGRRA